MLGSFLRHGLAQWEGESEILVQMFVNHTIIGLLLVMQVGRFRYNSNSNGTTHYNHIHVFATKLIAEILQGAKEQRIFSPIRFWSQNSSIPPSLYHWRSSNSSCRHWFGYERGSKGGRCHLWPVNSLEIKLATSYWGAFQNKKFWEHDAYSFRQERWLDSSYEQLKNMHDTMELVLSWGRFECLGKNVSSIKLNKVIVEVLFSPPFLCCHAAAIAKFWFRTYWSNETCNIHILY